MVHHCMLKETHTISYIQQVSHEWINGDEEEIAYAQATKSLRVVPINIQHGQEVLQRFKEAHELLVKALFNFENMESHGKPIKPILYQLITCTHLRKGLHYYSSLVVLVQLSKPYYSQGWWLGSIFT